MVGGMIRAVMSHDSIQIGPISIPVMLLDALLTLALLADVPIRYSYYLHDYEWSGGLLEWVLRRPKKEYTIDPPPEIKLPAEKPAQPVKAN